MLDIQCRQKDHDKAVVELIQCRVMCMGLRFQAVTDRNQLHLTI